MHILPLFTRIFKSIFDACITDEATDGSTVLASAYIERFLDRHHYTSQQVFQPNSMFSDTASQSCL